MSETDEAKIQKDALSNGPANMHMGSKTVSANPVVDIGK
jgi:hypothetical protein